MLHHSIRTGPFFQRPVSLHHYASERSQSLSSPSDCQQRHQERNANDYERNAPQAKHEPMPGSHIAAVSLRRWQISSMLETIPSARRESSDRKIEKYRSSMLARCPA